MSTISREMLKRCLFESTLDEIRKIESIDYSFVKASEQLKNKIKNNFEAAKQNKKKYYPKKIALILVAALTICFLIMFTVSAQIRTAVVDFFVEVYENFAMLFIQNDDINENPTTIEKEYKSTYFKENGFTQIEKTNASTKALTTWSKDGFYIYFSQYIIDENDIRLDIEHTQYEIIYVEEQKVYYKEKNDICTIKWLANGYSFNLRCSESLGWEEIQKIITSLEPITE